MKLFIYIALFISIAFASDCESIINNIQENADQKESEFNVLLLNLHKMESKDVMIDTTYNYLNEMFTELKAMDSLGCVDNWDTREQTFKDEFDFLKSIILNLNMRGKV
jgi:hypothetical protein